MANYTAEQLHEIATNNFNLKQNKRFKEIKHFILEMANEGKFSCTCSLNNCTVNDEIGEQNINKLESQGFILSVINLDSFTISWKTPKKIEKKENTEDLINSTEKTEEKEIQVPDPIIPESQYPRSNSVLQSGHSSHPYLKKFSSHSVHHSPLRSGEQLQVSKNSTGNTVEVARLIIESKLNNL